MIPFYRPDKEIPATLNKRPGHDAGYDLFATDTKWVWPFQTVKVETNLHIPIPENHVGIVAGRSGKSLAGWLTHVGIVDNGYLGRIGATLTNLSFLPRRIKRGERVAQLVVTGFKELKDLAEYPTLNAFTEEARQLTSSDRGEKGYNSSGSY